jgi:hypothetical protein
LIRRNVIMDVDFVLTQCNKSQMMAAVRRHPGFFRQALKILLAGEVEYTWRAAWLLNCNMTPNDSRMRKHVPALVALLPLRPESEQRELLKILLRMDIRGDVEGLLLDHCIAIWEQPYIRPGVRYPAMKTISNIVARHPELRRELDLLTQDFLMETITPGIRRSIMKMKGIRK